MDAPQLAGLLFALLFAVVLMSILLQVHCSTRYAIGQTVFYNPFGYGFAHNGKPVDWPVIVERNGLVFVQVRDRLTGIVFDALRWELTQ